MLKKVGPHGLRNSPQPAPTSDVDVDERAPSAASLRQPSINTLQQLLSLLRVSSVSKAMDVEESPWADSSQNTNLPSQSDDPSSPPSSSASQLGTSTSSRPSRGPRRMVAQPTRLEAVDDPLGPLSAASDNDIAAAEAPPAPPQKEQLPIRTTMSPQPQSQTRRPTDPHHIDYDDTESPSRGPRAPPPVDAARPSSVRSSTHPSVSVEQAAKPTFNITVGDPVKIGDLTSSHIVYSVRTKVSTLILA